MIYRPSSVRGERFDHLYYPNLKGKVWQEARILREGESKEHLIRLPFLHHHLLDASPLKRSPFDRISGAMVVSSASLPRARGFPRSEPSILGLTQGSCCRPCWLTMPRRRGKVVALALQSDHFLLSERSSPGEVKKEMNSCYELVNKLGRGVVYLGSSRLKEGHPHYEQAAKLASEIALLLDCTTWSGAGPGLMDAAVKGALQVNKPVGGFKIARESGEWTSSKIHPYLPPESYFTCRFFSARKHGLVEAAVRNNPSDMTAIVAFPGGIGTLDELFEMLALIQLERIGSKFQVPFLLMNYDSFYSKLLEFLDDCRKWGTVSSGEVESLWKVCSGNHEALDYLAAFYGHPRHIEQ